MSAPEDDEDRDGTWQFELDDVDADGIVEPERESIEPESPSPENALFVGVGALLAVALFYVTVSGVL